MVLCLWRMYVCFTVYSVDCLKGKKLVCAWLVAPMWSRAEESALSAGVAALGCSWTVIARLPALSARSATACRLHWTRHSCRLHQERSAVPGAILKLSAAPAIASGFTFHCVSQLRRSPFPVLRRCSFAASSSTLCLLSPRVTLVVTGGPICLAASLPFSIIPHTRPL